MRRVARVRTRRSVLVPGILGIGVIKALVPKIKRILKILEPMTFAIAISEFFL
jgi:hypothetical protein